MGDTVKAAIQALEAKALELTQDRIPVRRRLIEDAARDVEIERDIAGCLAGARALGWELELPEGPRLNQVQQAALNNFINSRNVMVGQGPLLKPVWGIKADDTEPNEVDLLTGEDMPRIADIIIDRLTAAGEEGSKAADIRRYILNTYDTDMHEKTVGMTLYRLQKAGKVRRDGQIWFLASPEAKNPGDGTPGPDLTIQT